MRTFTFLTFAFFLSLHAFSQNGVGIRFASNINWFPRAQDYRLVESPFTTGVLGVFLSRYKPNSGFEFGMNVVYKNNDNKGFPNLPVIMRDFGEADQNVGMTALEMDLKVGPRFKALNPKIGYILGYRLQQSGFQTDSLDLPQTRWYLMLPFGLSINLPTNYGSVGFGSYFNVGIFNMLKDPNPGGGNIYDGGRQRYVNFEIIVAFGTWDN